MLVSSPAFVLSCALSVSAQTPAWLPCSRSPDVAEERDAAARAKTPRSVRATSRACGVSARTASIWIRTRSRR